MTFNINININTAIHFNSNTAIHFNSTTRIVSIIRALDRQFITAICHITLKHAFITLAFNSLITLTQLVFRVKRNVNCAIIEMVARQHALTVQELYFAAPDCQIQTSHIHLIIYLILRLLCQILYKLNGLSFDMTNLF